MSCGRIESIRTRRDFLTKTGAGFGGVVLSALMGERLFGTDLGIRNPVIEKIPHHWGRARKVIFLFMEGGPSHLDLFDPKPLLNKLAGQPLPESFKRPVTAMGEAESPLLESRREWKQHGESGLWISDWLPQHGEIADDLCVIRSCVSDGINHAGGVSQMNTGSVFGGRPSLGAWVNYGLGSLNDNLPSYVVIKDSNAMVVNGARCWGSGFMPAGYQGTLFRSGPEPIANLNLPKTVSRELQNQKLAFLEKLNEGHLAGRESHSELAARMESYELAYRMQAEAPEAIDLENEPGHLRKAYGLENDQTAVFGRQCLMARRLVERGVRFVQLYQGAGSKWDSHSGMEKNHARLCGNVDQPIVALIRDLKQRGLLDETLVIWGGEFGRTPMSEKGDGRDHNPTGFTMWMAGGGVKGGQTIGATDDLGLYATEDKVHVHDLHATILDLMGLDHTKTVYLHKGRPERVDSNEGNSFAEKIAGQG